MAYDDDQDELSDGKPGEGEDQGENPEARGPFQDPTQPQFEEEADEADETARAMGEFGEEEEAESEPIDGPENPVTPQEPEIEDPGIPPFAGGDEEGFIDFQSKDEESAVPDFEEIDETQDSMEEFGNDLNAFNAAQGEEDPDEPEEEMSGNAKQIEADMGHRRLSNDMMVDHGRQIQDLTRALEIERL